MNKIKLSICMPTYNRSEKVIAQIQQIYKEFVESDYKDQIEILVSDNNSDKNHEMKLSESLKDMKDIKLNYNSKNLGLIGNLRKLLELSSGEYIWFVGDDDELEEGILEKVYIELKQNDFIFINHDAYIDTLDNVVMKQAIPENINKSNIVEQIFRYSETSLMFITACVYKKEILQGISRELCHGRLSDPLFYSILSGKYDKVGLITDIMIHNRWGDTSWSNQSNIIFLEEIPRGLLNLSKFGINNEELVKIYFKKRWKQLLKYNIKRGRIKDILAYIGYFSTIKI
ncbi:glycosyltransferase family 2 protein [Cetobacterium sp. ZWU0022]|uniref:glycosyltransferase family 2 protein n=1 Tax=Cetobacterium sp. ZWU0022 TaxID=1340502 RepID=UPI0006476234|nr:glycosyltransferase family 2 protein [Cetobacterium sp. ZWU0022]